LARVLVVDDDEALRKVVGEQLTDDGHDVVLAGGFDDALAAIARGMPDVLLTEFPMPPYTGEALLRVVQARYPAIGRILFTGSAHEETRGARAAAHLVLRKGCALAKVSASVSRCLEINRPPV
jgi:DNA-binding NtrC family response regulator